MNAPLAESPPALFADYPTRAVGSDELYAVDGAVRPSWRRLLTELQRLGIDELRHRSLEAKRLLRDHGVAYSAYSDPQVRGRAWQLDPLPLPLADDQWRVIERGLVQRAELLRLILTDLYGPRRLLGNGLPPELIFAERRFLRPAVGLPMESADRALPLYSADLARGPDDALYVIADRTQAVPGAGYALENRLVISRLMPGPFRTVGVRRLAGYFRRLRETLMRLAWQRRDDIRIVLLTPGPTGDSYFEQVFLANYLGYTLVQAADLSVREGQVWLKTLDGLQRVDVILRYLDDAGCDPLELRPGGGIAGLLTAQRQRQVALVNPPGVGLLENPALAAYLPTLAQRLLGEPLLLPTPTTFWCGEPAALSHVLANLHRLLIYHINAPASTPAADRRTAPLNGADLNADQRRELSAAIRTRPRAYVGREPLSATTAPTLADGNIEPRPLLLRSFLVADDSSYTVMPGGLARLSDTPDRPVGAVAAGGISKDIWVLTDAADPAAPLALLPTPDQAMSRYAMHSGELPSRVAENLYWLGRYAERSESIIRLLRAVFLYLLEPDEDYSASSNRAGLEALLRAVTELTETHPGFVGAGGKGRLAAPDAELLAVFLDRDRAGSLASNLAALLGAADAIRDRLSPDIWRVISVIDDCLRQLQTQHDHRDTLPFSATDNENLNSALDELDRLLTAFAAFTGLALDNMVHGQGWRFLQLGRRLERALQGAKLLRSTLAPVNADQTLLLEYLLRVCDSLMTYRSRYRSQLQPAPVLELLLQDETNPRSLSYQLRHLHQDLLALPGVTRGLPYRREEQALALKLLSRLRLSQIDQLLTVKGRRRPLLAALLAELINDLPRLSTTLGSYYFSHADRPQQLTGRHGE